jgi:hypothetical protein
MVVQPYTEFVKSKIWLPTVALFLSVSTPSIPASASAGELPSFAGSCFSRFVQGTDSYGPSLTWTPPIQIAFAGKKATVQVFTGGQTNIISINRTSGSTAYRWESLDYKYSFHNKPYDLGPRTIRFVITDGNRRSSTFTCNTNLRESDFPPALTSSAVITPGVLGGSFSKIKECRLNGIFLAGNVYISQSLTADFRVNKTTWQSSADLAVKITNFPQYCGEWKIVSSPALADFSIFLSTNSLYSDFQIYTGN